MDTHELEDLRRLRAVKNQSLFREVNERIEGIAKSFDLDGDNDQLDFICECAQSDCVERLQLSRREYEQLRSEATNFAIAAGHEIPSVERVVESNTRYLVVSKIGVAGEVAQELDPRR